MATETKYIDVPFEIKADDVEETGIFKGYGSVFGNKDSHWDIVMPGAFTKTLLKGGRNKTGVAMLYQHDSKRPIGIWNLLAEDKKGLRVEGQLAMKTQLGAETYELMKMGALKGLSIGYDTVLDEIDEKKKCRYIKEAELWEISPVTFGSNVKAQVLSVKSIKDAKTIREIEDALRESGQSKAEAQHFIAIIKEALRDSEKNKELNVPIDNDPLLGILDNLKKMNKHMDETGILNSLQRVNL